MTDFSYPIRSYAAQRLWPLVHLTEITVFLIVVFITNRLPSVAKISTFGWLGLLAFLFVVRRVELSAVLLRWWPLLLAPLLAFLSFIWSDYPSIPARYGFQLLLTAFAGVFLARCLSPSRMLTVLFLAMFVFCLLSVLIGRQGMSQEGLVLIGLVGSKNQMSFMGYVLLFSAFGALFDAKQHRIVRLLAPLAMALGGYIVATTVSATTLVMTVASIGLFIALCIPQRLKPGGRIGAIVGIAVVCSPLVVLIPEITQLINDFIIHVLHKDPGLTGRAALWARAEDLIAQRPVLGYGFQAIWLGNSSETLGLLRATGQLDGRVFNFHNTYRQFAVDTGLFGMVVVIATFSIATLAAARQYVMRPTVATTFFFVFLLLTLARTHTEVLLVPFSTPTVLLFICLTYAFWRPAPGWSDEAAPAQPAGFQPLPAAAAPWRPAAGMRAPRMSAPPPGS